MYMMLLDHFCDGFVPKIAHGALNRSGMRRIRLLKLHIELLSPLLSLDLATLEQYVYVFYFNLYANMYYGLNFANNLTETSMMLLFVAFSPHHLQKKSQEQIHNHLLLSTYNHGYSGPFNFIYKIVGGFRGGGGGGDDRGKWLNHFQSISTMHQQFYLIKFHPLSPQLIGVYNLSTTLHAGTSNIILKDARCLASFLWSTTHHFLINLYNRICLLAYMGIVLISHLKSPLEAEYKKIFELSKWYHQEEQDDPIKTYEYKRIIQVYTSYIKIR
ncbi:hypothetical protein ACJX0J_032609 [Zea mays]